MSNSDRFASTLAAGSARPSRCLASHGLNQPASLLMLIATLAAAAILSFLPARAQGAAVPTPAHTAQALNASDTARLHYLPSHGSSLLEEGPATGALPGTVKLHMTVGATVKGTFTINTHNGSIAGEASGTLHGTGPYTSFAGSMTVNHGTGRYAHAQGHGGFYGVLNRNTYAMTVQTTGTLSY